MKSDRLIVFIFSGTPYLARDEHKSIERASFFKGQRGVYNNID